MRCSCNTDARSLGRNQIKAFTGLEDILDTLEELWVSCVASAHARARCAHGFLDFLFFRYNSIDKFVGLEKAAALKARILQSDMIWSIIS